MNFSIGEILGAIIWAASGVEVVGYTFQAFKSTYSQFPNLGGSPFGANSFGNQAVNAGIGTDLQGVATGKPPADKAGSSRISQPGSSGIFGGAINAVTNWLGITKSPDQSVPTKGRPPRQQDTAIQNAVNSGNRQQALNLFTQIWRQQQKRGWNKADFQAWVDSRPWSQSLANLLASK